MRTGLVTDPVFLRHLTGAGHPERPERLPAVLGGLEGLDLVAVAPRDATRGELEGVHEGRYLDMVRAAAEGGIRQLDPDTFVCGDSYAAAVRAAGAALALGEAWLQGRIEAGFAAVRPPGHHAGRENAMGFCLFNNVAILARFLTSRGKRVAILDWDVHHGNGTQEVFEDDPSVRFLSLHQYPLWPMTGLREEKGAGNITNIPMPPASGDREYLLAFDREVVPWLEDGEPDALLISCGFDAHARDPLAQQRLSSEAFALFTKKVARQPVLSLLEGGYDLEALASSARAHVQALIAA
ncbi:MAG TPA: histone deacetylase [Planctomycetota bacterium]|nr:histone deacetylase [Planctomycetota bacterium]